MIEFFQNILYMSGSLLFFGLLLLPILFLLSISVAYIVMETIWRFRRGHGSF
ncbi:hypothetical protein [Oscillibacter sp.]|uniref:hypothetical protein n=1 Tax=Oscillibacter sp. TaxID=1945593 RepID=UPI0026198A05|nr:hypothetical protein [Oscillibacter sp.]MDD3346900.1 hypothetical protein [Oscillibacter sp.]